MYYKHVKNSNNKKPAKTKDKPTLKMRITVKIRVWGRDCPPLRSQCSFHFFPTLPPQFFERFYTSFRFLLTLQTFLNTLYICYCENCRRVLLERKTGVFLTKLLRFQFSRVLLEPKFPKISRVFPYSFQFSQSLIGTGQLKGGDEAWRKSFNSPRVLLEPDPLSFFHAF